MTDIKKAGVMGWPIEHSLSPRLHGYWLKQYGIDGEYTALPVPPENLGDAFKSLIPNGFCGVNLTVPHKELAMLEIKEDNLDDLAKRAGATNTVTVRDGELWGTNTDIYGFTQNLLTAGFEPGSGIATLIGAGGAARAALVALLDMGLDDIRIVNRTRAKANLLERIGDANLINAFEWNEKNLQFALQHSNILINATSLGLKGQPPLEIALDALPTTAWVTDMVYAPLETDLLKRAKGRGNKTVDGLGMLLHQARPAFQMFFGKDPEVTQELRDYVLRGKP